jgi:hypothetical protein
LHTIYGCHDILKTVSTSNQKTVPALLLPVLWIIELITAFAGQEFHEEVWHANHPVGAVTEEDVMALRDCPNVLALWVTLGWVPIAVGLILSKIGNKKPIH